MQQLAPSGPRYLVVQEDGTKLSRAELLPYRTEGAWSHHISCRDASSLLKIFGVPFTCRHNRRSFVTEFNRLNPLAATAYKQLVARQMCHTLTSAEEYDTKTE